METAFEIWKDVEGYEGAYQVSNIGFVRMKCDHGFELLTPIPSAKVYKKILLKNPARCISIHRLVAKHFVDNPNNHPEVNHIDAKKHNNVSTNLEWTTKKGNVQHALNNGLYLMGETHSQSKLRNEDVYEIRKMFSESTSPCDLSKKFKISKDAIYKIVHKRSWKHLKTA